MNNLDTYESINLLKPAGRYMKREVLVIMFILAGWLFAIIGFQLVILALKSNSTATLNDITLFNLPIHYWLTGQLLPLWFVILCGAFNLWVDRHPSPEQGESLRMVLRVNETSEEK